MTRRIEDYSEKGRSNRERQRKYRAAHAVELWWRREFSKLSVVPGPLPEHMTAKHAIYEVLGADGSPERAVAALVGREPAGAVRSSLLPGVYSKPAAVALAGVRSDQLKVGL